MKSIPVSFHRRMTQELAEKAGFESDLTISRLDGGPLRKVDVGEGRLLVKSDDGWDISEGGMSVNVRLKVRSPEALYDSEGLVSDSERLGVAAICRSTDSDQCEVHPLCALEPGVQADSSFDIRLDPGKYRRSVALCLEIYVRSSDRSGLMPGTVMGDVRTTRIEFDEQTCGFPTVEADRPGGPLWWVNVSWTDITQDSFTSDNVAMVVNRSNKDCERIDPSSKSFDRALFIESVSGAVQAIVQEAMHSSDFASIMSTDTHRDGSIAQAVHYMVATNQWDYSSPSALSESIRRFFYREVRV